MVKGAKSYMEPVTEEDENGKVVRSGIYTYGETVHVFVERKDYNGIFLPGYRKYESSYNPTSVGLKYVDHMVGNVELGRMNHWVKFYEEVLENLKWMNIWNFMKVKEFNILLSQLMMW